MVLLFVPTDLLQFNKSFSAALRLPFASLFRWFKELFLAENSFPLAGVHMLPGENNRSEKRKQSEHIQRQYRSERNAQTVRSERFIASLKGSANILGWKFLDAGEVHSD